jgi:hypothetical protein
VAIVNCETYGSSDSSWSSSDSIKELCQRLNVPFNGITATVHINIHIYIGMILEEAKLYSGINELLDISRKSKKMHDELAKFISKVMERVRSEYRIFFARPSYRELLIKGYNLFMLRSRLVTYEQFNQENPLDCLLYLIVNRVQQEYFNQFRTSSKYIFSAMQRNSDGTSDELIGFQTQIDNVRLCAEGDEDDSEVFRVQRSRIPQLLYYDHSLNPVIMVFDQWLKYLLPSSVTWTSWVSPNKAITVEELCIPVDKNIKDIHEKILEHNILETGHRILVMPDIGSLFTENSYVGFKMQQWMKRWVADRSDRTIALICPSRNDEGTRLVGMNYFNGEHQLIIQMLSTLHRSNSTVISQIRQEQSNYLKEKGLTSNKKLTGSRMAQQKQLEEDNARKLLMEQHLADKLNALTPDGYLIAECRSITGSQGDKLIAIRSMELKVIGSPTSISGEYDEWRPGLFDYIELPLWFKKFVPATAGVFVQDEINLVIRQEPHSRKLLDYIENNEDLHRKIRQIYEESKLSELSRPTDLQEVNIHSEGLIEMFLEDLVYQIWEIVPESLRQRMLPLTDSFVKSFCISRTLNTDRLKWLSSSEIFLKFVLNTLLATSQLFLATKMSSMTKWKYIIDAEEFPKDVFENPESEESEESSDESEIAVEEKSNRSDNEEIEVSDDINDDKKEGTIITDIPLDIPTVQQTVNTTINLPIEITEESLRSDLYVLCSNRIMQRRSYGEQITFMNAMYL